MNKKEKKMARAELKKLIHMYLFNLAVAYDRGTDASVKKVVIHFVPKLLKAGWRFDQLVSLVMSVGKKVVLKADDQSEMIQLGEFFGHTNFAGVKKKDRQGAARRSVHCE